MSLVLIALASSVVAQDMPTEQRQFIAAIETGRNAYSSASNDMAKGGTRALRKQSVCRSLSDTTARNWFGTIESLSSNGEGKGVLMIRLAPDLRIGTWNNAFSDVSEKTLIEPGSSVHNAASAMKKGDKVSFSGRFFRDGTDCVREKSMTLSGSMTSPDYLFAFTSIERR